MGGCDGEGDTGDFESERIGSHEKSPNRLCQAAGTYVEQGKHPHRGRVQKTAPWHKELGRLGSLGKIAVRLGNALIMILLTRVDAKHTIALSLELGDPNLTRRSLVNSTRIHDGGEVGGDRRVVCAETGGAHGDKVLPQVEARTELLEGLSVRLGSRWVDGAPANDSSDLGR